MSITKTSTLNMDREAWLRERRKSIGGSDAGTILGLNAYTSPYALWCEKTGRIIPDDISDKEAVRLGNDLEQYVADRFMEATGKKVRKCNAILTNTDYPFAHANVDRLIVGENAGLECKTTSSWEILQKCREGQYPDTWYAQMTHYMMVTGAERWYLAVLVFGRGFFWFTIERSEAEINALEDAESEFWKLVETDTPPDVDGKEATTEALSAIYSESSKGTGIDLLPLSGVLHTYAQLKKNKTDLEEQITACENHIKEYMGNAETGIGGAFSVSWKTQNRSAFDRKAYEAANGPIPKQFFKNSTSRPFKVTMI